MRPKFTEQSGVKRTRQLSDHVWGTAAVCKWGNGNSCASHRAAHTGTTRMHFDEDKRKEREREKESEKVV